jgi:hypothetical protein
MQIFWAQIAFFASSFLRFFKLEPSARVNVAVNEAD